MHFAFNTVSLTHNFIERVIGDCNYLTGRYFGPTEIQHTFRQTFFCDWYHKMWLSPLVKIISILIIMKRIKNRERYFQFFSLAEKKIPFQKKDFKNAPKESYRSWNILQALIRSGINLMSFSASCNIGLIREYSGPEIAQFPHMATSKNWKARYSSMSQKFPD